MSAMENMVRTLLRALDVDVDEVKKEVTGRIKIFEQNVDTLNATLVTIMQTQQRIERNQHIIAAVLRDYLNIEIILEPIPTANGATSQHDAGNGKTITAIAQQP